MNPTLTWAELAPAGAEVFLLAAICVVLLVDLVLDDRRRWITYLLAIVSLAGAAWMAVSVYRTLSGRITLNHFGTHAYLACLFLLVGEILGRFLFYATHIRLGI